MVIGACRLTFALPEVDSLKGKRSIVRRMIDRTRAKFSVSISEVGALDSHRQAIIGFAVVSNDSRHANEMVDTIVAFASNASDALLLDRSMELVHLGDSLGANLGGGMR